MAGMALKGQYNLVSIMVPPEVSKMPESIMPEDPKKVGSYTQGFTVHERINFEKFPAGYYELKISFNHLVTRSGGFSCPAPMSPHLQNKCK